jgi:aconitate hydratase
MQPVKCALKHEDGSSDEFMLQHTMNAAQIGWFQAGSALNKMAEILK